MVYIEEAYQTDRAFQAKDLGCMRDKEDAGKGVGRHETSAPGLTVGIHGAEHRRAECRITPWGDIVFVTPLGTALPPGGCVCVRVPILAIFAGSLHAGMISMRSAISRLTASAVFQVCQ